MSDSLRPHGLQPIRLLHPWDFPGKSTGMDCHFLLQGIFPTQGMNLGFPRYRQTLYHLSHHGINIPKGTKDLYAENCKTLMNKIKDNRNRWRDIPCCIGTVSFVKMTILPEAIYKFNAIPMKLPMAFVHSTRTKQKKFTVCTETQQIAKEILRKQNSWRNQPSSLQTILQSYSHQDSMVLSQK